MCCRRPRRPGNFGLLHLCKARRHFSKTYVCKWIPPQEFGLVLYDFYIALDSSHTYIQDGRNATIRRYLWGSNADHCRDEQQRAQALFVSSRRAAVGVLIFLCTYLGLYWITTIFLDETRHIIRPGMIRKKKYKNRNQVSAQTLGVFSRVPKW